VSLYKTFIDSPSQEVDRQRESPTLAYCHRSKLKPGNMDSGCAHELTEDSYLPSESAVCSGLTICLHASSPATP
jgi:hypothetical protein